MKKLIVSAFEPFGGSGRNSSLETLWSLPEILYGHEIVKVTLPVVYGECGRLLCGKIAEYEPSEIAAVICLGQAAGRGSITPEYAAVSSSGRQSIKITLSVEALSAQTLTLVYYKGGSGSGSAGLAAIAVN